ncbi:MAG: ribonuclease HII [Fibrobacterota bacterium]
MQTMLFSAGLDVIDGLDSLDNPHDFDAALHNAGVVAFLGVDEAGRGPLAGPVVAAAVLLPANHGITRLRDSKKVPEPEREELYAAVVARALCWSAAVIDAGTIDRINILNAALLAMRQAVESTGSACPVLVDGNRAIPGLRNPQRALVRGDARSATVAAASIVAKVTRDRLMRGFDAQYPRYGFARHKGYGTADHLQSLRNHGPSPIHRKTFKGVL